MQRNPLFLFLSMITFLMVMWYNVNADDSKAVAKQGFIAVVDVEKIMSESTAAKDAIEKIKIKRDKSQAEITRADGQLKKEEEQLQKEQSTLSEEVFEKKHQQFREKIAKFHQDVQEKRAALESYNASAQEQIYAAALDVIAEVAKLHNANIVIPSSQTLYISDDVKNITSEVLDKINTKISKVSIKKDDAKSTSGTEAPVKKKKK